MLLQISHLATPERDGSFIAVENGKQHIMILLLRVFCFHYEPTFWLGHENGEKAFKVILLSKAGGCF